jgi:hypothetical protein
VAGWLVLTRTIDRNFAKYVSKLAVDDSTVFPHLGIDLLDNRPLLVGEPWRYRHQTAAWYLGFGRIHITHPCVSFLGIRYHDQKP